MPNVYYVTKLQQPVPWLQQNSKSIPYKARWPKVHTFYALNVNVYEASYKASYHTAMVRHMRFPKIFYTCAQKTLIALRVLDEDYQYS
jgi:hypothetical protein